MSVLFVGILSTQKSESTNHMLNGICSNQTSLLSMFHSIEQRIREWRDAEVGEDFRNRGSLSVKFRCSLLMHAAEVYTFRIYKEFEDELEIGSFADYKLLSEVDGVSEYEVANQDSEGRYCMVSFRNSDSIKVNCSCKHFEEMGWFCLHILRIFNVRNVTTIPTAYIVRRWTKNARAGKRIDSMGGGTNVKFVSMFWRNKLMKDIYDVVISCQEIEEARHLCEQWVTDLSIKVSVCLSSNQAMGPSSSCVSGVDETGIQNPLPVRTKGRSKKRIQSYVEKQLKKSKK